MGLHPIDVSRISSYGHSCMPKSMKPHHQKHSPSSALSCFLPPSFRPVICGGQGRQACERVSIWCPCVSVLSVYYVLRNIAYRDSQWDTSATETQRIGTKCVCVCVCVGRAQHSACNPSFPTRKTPHVIYAYNLKVLGSWRFMATPPPPPFAGPIHPYH